MSKIKVRKFRKCQKKIKIPKKHMLIFSKNKIRGLLLEDPKNEENADIGFMNFITFFGHDGKFSLRNLFYGLIKKS